VFITRVTISHSNTVKSVEPRRRHRRHDNRRDKKRGGSILTNRLINRIFRARGIDAPRVIASTCAASAERVKLAVKRGPISPRAQARAGSVGAEWPPGDAGADRAALVLRAIINI